ncbi:MAG: glycosyltransferase [Candidatus Methanomethyliaceae archaeon]
MELAYSYRQNESVVAVIWLFNPNIERFSWVLRSIIGQVDKIILVDNNSSNIKQIQDVCEGLIKDKIMLLELRFNSGVYALNLGMKYVCDKFNPMWILLLDQDTIVYPDAVAKVLTDSNPYKDRIGALCMTYVEKSPNEKQVRKFYPFRYGMFSGSLINARLIKQGIKVREDFFLDQADHDFFDRIRSHGFLTVACSGEKLIDHKLGTLIHVRLPFRGVTRVYEPAWRYYYIVRNSTVLLMEGKLDIRFYIRQLRSFAIPLIFSVGIVKFLKTLTLGLAHGLGRKLGYLDPKILERVL